MLLHVVRETDNGIVVRGAKYETAAAYANQAFVKPTIGDWGDAELCRTTRSASSSTWARPASRHICRTGFAGRRPADDYPLSNRFDEVDTLIVFDDVEIPWENVLFYRHTRAAAFIRATLHRYSAFPFVQRNLRFADLLIGAASPTSAQTGLEDAAGGAGEARTAGVLPRGHQRPPDRRDRARRAEPGRPADAQPVAALHRPRARLRAAPGDDAHRPRAVRRADLRDARTRRRSEHPETRALAGRSTIRVGDVGGRGPAPAARLRARPAQLRLRRPPADVPALRPVAAVRPPAARCTATSTSPAAARRSCAARRPVRAAWTETG